MENGGNTQHQELNESLVQMKGYLSSFDGAVGYLCLTERLGIT